MAKENREPIELDMRKIIYHIKDLSWCWYPLDGGKYFECPQRKYKNWQEGLKFHKKTGNLWQICNDCYKPKIIFDEFNQENLDNLSRMLNSWQFDFLGKLNNKVAYFYFRQREEAINFTKFLEEEMEKFNIRGIVDWQRGCMPYWREHPELWREGKEFLGTVVETPEKIYK